MMPIIYILSGGLSGDVTPALGGIHWQSLVYAIWEQLFCLSMIITLLHFFKHNLNYQNRINSELAGSSYASYIIHSLVVVVFTLLIQDILLHPLLKIPVSYTHLTLPTTPYV